MVQGGSGCACGVASSVMVALYSLASKRSLEEVCVCRNRVEGFRCRDNVKVVREFRASTIWCLQLGDGRA